MRFRLDFMGTVEGQAIVLIVLQRRINFHCYLTRNKLVFRGDTSDFRSTQIASFRTGYCTLKSQPEEFQIPDYHSLSFRPQKTLTLSLRNTSKKYPPDVYSLLFRVSWRQKLT